MKITKSQQELLDDLVGHSEIAELAGTSRGQVAVWAGRRKANGFPEPVVSLRAGSFYRRSEVATWLASYVPSSGRPKR